MVVQTCLLREDQKKKAFLSFLPDIKTWLTKDGDQKLIAPTRQPNQTIQHKVLTGEKPPREAAGA